VAEYDANGDEEDDSGQSDDEVGVEPSGFVGWENRGADESDRDGQEAEE